MDKRLLSVFSALLIGTLLIAQDKAEISVRITKNGELLKDTTYTYDDPQKAEDAIALIAKLGSGDIDSEMMESANRLHKKMIFISDDGDIDTLDNDLQLLSITSSEEGESGKVYTVKRIGNAHAHTHTFISDDDTEAQLVTVNEDDGKIEVIIRNTEDEKLEHVHKKNKKVIVIDEDDESGPWTVKEGESGEMMMMNDEGQIIELKKESASENADGEKTEKWISVDKDGDHVNVEVIKKVDKSEKNVELEVTVKEKKENKKKDKKRK